MTVQEVKAKLNAVRAAYREYELAKEKAVQFRGMLSGASQGFSDAPQTEHRGNCTEEKYFRMLEYSERANEKFREYIMHRLEAEKMIASLNYSDEREILTRRYILNEKWDIIANGTNYSIRHVTRLHGYALIHLSCP